MKAFGRYALLAYFLLAGTLICSAQEEAETPSTTATVAVNEDVQVISSATADIEITNNAQVNIFLNSCKKLSDKIEEMNSFGDVWYWSNSHNKDTYQKQFASEYKVCNDALFTCWALADCKIFKNGERFYTNDNGEIVFNKGNSESTIDEYFDTIEMNGAKAKDLVKDGKIRAGDICCYDFVHTNVYAGNNLWFDPSPKSCEVVNKDGKDYFVKILTPIGAVDHGVNYVLRFKNSSPEEKPAVASTDKKKETKKDQEETTYTGEYKKDCKSFLAALKMMSDKIAADHKAGKKWYYSNSKTKGTFASAVKTDTRKTNCARYVNWGLSEIGVLDGESFYTTTAGTIKWSSDKTKKKVLKYCKIISVKKKMSTCIKDGTLKPGDICCYNFQHTNVYAGNNYCYDAGRRGDTTYKKGGTSYFKSFHSKTANKNWVINYIIRLKE